MLHQKVLVVSPFEAQLFVEAGTVGSHEIHPFCAQQSGIFEQGFHHLSAQSETLQVSSYYDVPYTALQSPSLWALQKPTRRLPRHRPQPAAVLQKRFEIAQGAILGPEDMLV